MAVVIELNMPCRVRTAHHCAASQAPAFIVIPMSCLFKHADLLQPGGLPAISRGLSEATPPDIAAKDPRPRRGRSNRTMNLCALFSFPRSSVGTHTLALLRRIADRRSGRDWLPRWSVGTREKTIPHGQNDGIHQVPCRFRPGLCRSAASSGLRWLSDPAQCAASRLLRPTHNANAPYLITLIISFFGGVHR